MALAPLASVADLTLRGIDTSNEDLCEALLGAASAAIREAAGSPISEVTSTVVLDGVQGSRLALPSGPVTSVDSVTIDGNAVTDYIVHGGILRRGAGWAAGCHGIAPAPVEVTYTHGYPEVPADIVNLVCMFVAAGLAEAADGARAGIVGERIDDYSVQYAQGEQAVASAMEIPERTQRMLRARFGGGVYVTSEPA
jgi:hypothetical protein